MGQGLRPLIFIPARLPHTHPGAESGQQALFSASINQWSGCFTSGARGSGQRGPPSAALCSHPGAPPRPARRCRELAASPFRCRSGRPAKPNFAARGSSRGGGGVGRGELTGSGGGAGREGRPLASPPSFLCTLR